METFVTCFRYITGKKWHRFAENMPLYIQELNFRLPSLPRPVPALKIKKRIETEA